MKYLAMTLVLTFLTLHAVAQSTTAGSPSKSIGVFVFPKNNQNADQQLKDETECYGLARQQTGLDPQAPAPAPISAEGKQAQQQEAADNAPKGERRSRPGAARGAAAGAEIGAIAGDAGKGAAIGAVAGTMGGGMRQRRANAAAKEQAAHQTAAAQKEAESEAKLAHNEGLDTFQRAFGAYLDARSYSVK